MIRREDLAVAARVSYADGLLGDLRGSVQRGESVRITGLGTLRGARGSDPGTSWGYRITLTAAVAKRANAPDKLGPRLNLKDGLDVFADAKHLARALGAPVEVWTAEGRRGDVIVKPAHVTTVHP